MRTSRFATASLAAFLLSACGRPAAECPLGTQSVGGQCVAGCTTDYDCLRTERCDPMQGVCIALAGVDASYVADSAAADVVSQKPDSGDAGLPGQDASGGADATQASDSGIHPDAVAEEDAGFEDGDAAGEDVDLLRQDAAQPDGGSAPDATPRADAGVGSDSSTASDSGFASDAAAGDAGFVSATTSANNLSFGRIVAGDQLVLTLSLINSDPTASAQVRIGQLTGANPGAFTVSAPGGGSTSSAVRVAPVSRTDLTITFRSTSPGGPRTASLSLDLCDAGCLASIYLQGEALDDAIVCAPPSIGYGQVNPTSCVNARTTCANQSTRDATIFSWALSSATPTDFRLATAAPLSPRVLPPSSAQDVYVEYCPPDFGSDSGALLVNVLHPNPSRQMISVALSGAGGGPDIHCATDAVDFGLIGVGLNASRVVSCTNRGTAPLTVSSVDLSQNLGGELGVTYQRNGTAASLPLVLNPNDSVAATLAFRPARPRTLSLVATVRSNDLDSPAIDVSIAGDAISTAGCLARVVWENLPFGAVHLGDHSVLPVRIANDGTGNCAVTILGLDSARSGTTSPFGVDAPYTQTPIAPGAYVQFFAGFSPTAPSSYMDTLQLQVSDAARPFVPVRFDGAGYDGPIWVGPGLIDYRRVPVRCGIPVVRWVGLYHAGQTGRETILGWSLVSGSSNAFVFPAPPAVQPQLTPSAPYGIPVGFDPSRNGTELARLQIDFSGGLRFYVTMLGEGAQTGANLVDYGTITGYADTFDLGAPPVPGSVSVMIDSQVIPAATSSTGPWFADNAGGRVVFDPTRVPAVGTNVRIGYDVFCPSPTCGNSAVETGEQCDDGNQVDDDACPTSCYNPGCGDTHTRTGVEQCDDGNTIPGDGCNWDCTLEGCGNGIAEAPLEECDDGNLVDNDGCTNLCAWNTPGFAVTSQQGLSLPMRAAMNPMTVSIGTNDDGFAVQAIGFPFSYLGTQVSAAYVSTNGYITFEVTSDSAHQNRALPDVASPNMFVAWWWDDLYPWNPNIPQGAQMTTRLIGAPGSWVRVFRFENIPMYGAAAASSGYTLVNAEVRLHQGTNLIEVHYGALGSYGQTPSGFTATAGWEGPSSWRGENVLTCGPFCGASDWPTDTVFTFTP